jgi:hypothetical protein
MFNLWATDSPEEAGIDMHFSDLYEPALIGHEYVHHFE